MPEILETILGVVILVIGLVVAPFLRQFTYRSMHNQSIRETLREIFCRGRRGKR